LAYDREIQSIYKLIVTRYYCIILGCNTKF